MARRVTARVDDPAVIARVARIVAAVNARREPRKAPVQTEPPAKTAGLR